MPEVVIRDVVIWAKHIHGDARLKTHITTMGGGGDIELVVDGVKGHWRKMADGRDGRPTSGLVPQGRMQAFWKELYASRRGDSVSICLPSSQGRGQPDGGERPSDPADRSAAIQRLLNPAQLYSSEGRSVSRDELYERW